MNRYTIFHEDGAVLETDIDGEWVRYEDHCEAMKRIAGGGVAGTLSFDIQVKMDHYTSLTELAEKIRALAAPSDSAQQAQPVAWHIGNADGSINKIGAVYIRRSLAEKHIESYEGELDACIVPLYAAPAPTASPADQVGWIPVSERFPPRNQDVILALTTGAVLVGFYYGQSMGWDWPETDADEDADAAVTHWMSMPAAPDDPDDKHGVTLLVQDDVRPNFKVSASPAALTAGDQQTLKLIYDAMSMGTGARTLANLLACIENVKHHADCIDAVEREFFMVPGEPDEDDPDSEPGDECLLNRWGSTVEQYVEQFRAAIPRLVAASPAADQAADRHWRAGFLAGWNAGIEGDEAKLRAAQNRVGKLADYEAGASTADPTGAEAVAVGYVSDYGIAQLQKGTQAFIFPKPNANIETPVYLATPSASPASAQHQGVVAWVRIGADGNLREEFLPDRTIEPVRKQSGGWLPLVPAAQQTAAEDARDAARYRWLRDSASGPYLSKKREAAFNALARGEWWEDIDNAIDAAMSASKEESNG